MGMRKDYYLKGVPQALAMVKAIHLYDLVFVKKIFAASFIKRSVHVTAADLDACGIRVRQDGDVFDFVQATEGDDLSYCTEAVDQWRMEAMEAIESGAVNVVQLARACNLSRQTLYRIVKNNNSGLQHYFELMGKVPLLRWHGSPLAAVYEACRADLERAKIMEKLT